MRRSIAIGLLLAAGGCATFEADVRNLASADCAVRQQAAEALGRRRDPRAVVPLVEALAIASCEEHGVITSGQLPAAAALGVIGAPAFEPTLAAFKDRPELRMGAALALAQIADPRAVEPLLAEIRRVAPDARAWIATPDDREARFKTVLVWALGRFNDARVVPVLMEAQAADRALYWLYYAATQSLSRSAAARDNLLAQITDPAADVRIRALAALQESDNPAAFEKVLPLVDDPNNDVRGGAFRVLDRIAVFTPQAVRVKAIPAMEAIIARGDFDIQASDLLALLGQPGRERLYTMLKAPSSRLRARAASALRRGQIEALRSKDIELLVHALDDMDGDVRFNAAGTVEGLLDDRRVRAALLEHLHRKDLAVVSGAMGAYVRLGEPDSEQTIIAALNDTTSYGTGAYFKAEFLLNCGNAVLERAAAEWARTRGYRVEQKLPGDPSRRAAMWGQR